jgi:glucose/arabinose dehydrogenase
MNGDRMNGRRLTLGRSGAVLATVLAVAGTALVTTGARSTKSQLRPAVPAFSVSVAIGGHGELTLPTAVAFASDGRIFVAEAGGKIKIFSGPGDTTATVFANLSTEVYSFQGHGLLGLALDPQFPTRPYVYALYSRDSKTLGGPVPGWNDGCPTPMTGCMTFARLVRLTANGNVATSARKVLVDGWCNQFQHTVDAVRFGPDGMLYAGSGDGSTYTTADYGQLGSPQKNPCGDPPGGAGATLTPPTSEGGSLRAQDVRTNGDPAGLAGTLIRIDPNTGAAAAGNPYIASPDLNKRRVIAYGLRNPFRFTFRPGTNELWLGDAGWSTKEEIDRIPNATDSVAENFGWPCYEGAAQQPTWASLNMNLCSSLYAAHTAVNPAFAYTDQQHVVAGESCATATSAPTGIGFYQGSSYPTAYQRGLFFADYGRMCVWVAPAAASGLPDFTKRKLVLDVAPAGITDLEAGPNGDFYLVDNTNGKLLDIQYG